MLRGLAVTVVASLLLVACDRDASSASGPAGSAVRPDEHGGAQPVPMNVVRTICSASPCTGKLARVLVWRDAKGRVGAFEVRGDIERCSHPPTLFYDAAGKQTGVIPMKPVTPGSPEAKGFLDTRAKATKGLKQVDSVRCP